jgi:hypothetical protein
MTWPLDHDFLTYCIVLQKLKVLRKRFEVDEGALRKELLELETKIIPLLPTVPAAEDRPSTVGVADERKKDCVVS